MTKHGYRPRPNTEFGRLCLEVEGMLFDFNADRNTCEYYMSLRDRMDFQGMADFRDELTDRWAGADV